MPEQFNADTPDLEGSGVVGAFVTTPDGDVELRADHDAFDIVTITWNSSGTFSIELADRA